MTKRFVWIREHVPGPRDVLLWLRVYLFGPRLVTFSDRLPLIILILGLLLGGGYTYHKLITGDAARARRACTSYAANADLASALNDLLGIADPSRLTPSGRAKVATARVKAQRAHDVQEALRRLLQCPPRPEGQP